MSKLLILGGTSDAVALARQAADMDHLEVTYSLAGVTSNPNLPDCPVRQGGFDGAEGLAGFLKAQGFDMLLDATHPFASQIAANAAQACEKAGVAHLKYLRPPWQPQAGDEWLEVGDMEAAADSLAIFDPRVFLSVGVRDLTAFTGLTENWFLVRLMEKPGGGIPLQDFHLHQARGPFELADERALMEEHKIHALVSKNSGGEAIAAKLTAARQLKIPVIMIGRPPPPPGGAAESPEEVLDWLER